MPDLQTVAGWVVEGRRLTRLVEGVEHPGFQQPEEDVARSGLAETMNRADEVVEMLKVPGHHPGTARRAQPSSHSVLGCQASDLDV